jgi:hypothetical protein
MVTSALRDRLAGVLSTGLCERLDDGPGWEVESGGQVLEWEEVSSPEQSGDHVCWAVAHSSGLRADVTLQRAAGPNAAMLQVTLSNPADRTSPPISSIKLVRLCWPEMPREWVQARSVGGGLFHAHDPPGAYRENAVVFRPGVGEGFRIESGPDGRSSNRDLPFLQMTVGGSVQAGLVVVLEWSGEWYQELGYIDGWHKPLTWEAGIPVTNLVLPPGDTLELPRAHLIAFEGDQDAGGNACRRHVYDRVCPDLDGRRPLPATSYDHWSGIERLPDKELHWRLVDRAAELGVEYLVLDSGWQGLTPGAEASVIPVGNWDRTRVPGGIEPLADYVRSKGMRFGLWFDAERAHRDSDLAQAHPDWFIDIGEPILHLDLTLREAQNYLIQMVGGWIERLGVEWIRWDYNIGPRPYWGKADPTGRIQFEYLDGLYRVFDSLIAAYPNCLIEHCASGGRRSDLGLFRRGHTSLNSDHSADALICRFMLTGGNRFLPATLLNNNLAVELDAGDGTISDADVVSRMCGAVQFTGDIASWSPELTGRVAELVRVYEEFRHLLVRDFYPLTPQPARPEEPEAVEFISLDGADAVILGFSGVEPIDEITVLPRALTPGAVYVVRDPLVGGEIRRRADALLSDGLRLPLGGGAAVRRLRREAEA